MLIVGSGGREHALAWSLARSAQVGQVYVAPGNAGTTWPTGNGMAACTNVNIPMDDIPALVRFAVERHVDLTVIGPEAVLAAGIVDTFNASGLRVFGPSRQAAQIETSKAYAKAIMDECSIPNASYQVFSDYEPARQFIQELKRPVVVKADGLAAGKGAIICDDFETADSALRRMLVAREFGASGSRVIIEERLNGPEISVLAFCDGHNLLSMPPARDHKRIYDGDEGLNTGGMGAYAPVAEVDAGQLDVICRTILQPVIDVMARRNAPYIGVLYAGLMLTTDGPKVLEYNCRFGDPETQVVIPLLDGDLFDVLMACVEGRLEKQSLCWRPGACVTVVAASSGYPATYPVGLPISGDLETNEEDLMIFHAGTALKESRLVTMGGRVLSVSAWGADLANAANKAYQRIARIHFDGMQYRRDIGIEKTSGGIR